MQYIDLKLVSVNWDSNLFIKTLVYKCTLNKKREDTTDEFDRIVNNGRLSNLSLRDGGDQKSTASISRDKGMHQEDC